MSTSTPPRLCKFKPLISSNLVVSLWYLFLALLCPCRNMGMANKMLSQKREMFMVRFLSAQSLVTLRIWGPLKEDRQFVKILCHKWRYCPVNKIFWAWFVAMLRKGDIWGLVWSNALDRRYLRSDFCTGFAPSNDGTQRTGGGCTLQILSLLSRWAVGFSFSNRALFKFVLVMFFWTSKTSISLLVMEL